MNLKLLLLIDFIFAFTYLSAQQATYPKNYFRNPLDIPMELVANFGELRSDHWHMGLDIRTNQRENLPVYAAADGYVAHIGIRPQGYGQFIIINHTNGFSTLYAHLNNYFPELKNYVIEQQYKQESWAVELDFTKNKFPVSKGQIIGYSGNTGGSQGPHLHFEILDTKTGKRFNTLLFGLPLTDNVPPTLLKLAMYDRSKSIYETTPDFFSLKNTGNGYIISKTPVIKTGFKKISFAIQAYDRMSGSNNQDGIYSAELFVNEEPQVRFVLDSIDFDLRDYVNANVDYKFRYNGGAFFQHLSQLPGNNGPAYKRIEGDGVIHLSDTTIQLIRIEVKDTYNNISQLNFAVQYDSSLVIAGVDPAQYPRFIPNTINVLKKNDFEINIPAYCLYDSFQSLYSRNNSSLHNAVTALHRLNDAFIPLHGNMGIRIKPDKPIPAEWRDKILIQHSYRNSKSVRKAIWQVDSTGTNDSWLTARFDEFGSFQAFADTEAPKISELGKGDTVNLSASKKIVFQTTDNFEVIKSFRAELDDQWLLFTNDKRKAWIYEFDEHCPYGVHELNIKVEDLAGNTTTKTWWFKRYPYTPPKKKVIGKKKIIKKSVKNN